MSPETRMAEAVDNAEIGLAIARVRHGRRLTQAQLAVACGRTHQQICKFESGANRVSVAALLALARALSVPVTDLLPPLAFHRLSPAEPWPTPPVAVLPDQASPHLARLLAEIRRFAAAELMEPAR